MIGYAYFDESTGVILRSGIAQDEKHTPSGSGKLLVSDNFNISAETHYVDVRTLSIVEKPTRPGRYHEWDQRSLKWVISPTLVSDDVVFRRNGLLSASDWTQLPDVPLEAREAWCIYRQALRDITGQPGFPLDVRWPEKPSN